MRCYSRVDDKKTVHSWILVDAIMNPIGPILQTITYRCIDKTFNKLPFNVSERIVSKVKISGFN